MSLILVGLGGFCGGLSRFLLGSLISRKSGSSFPVGTFFINMAGALLLGILTGAAPARQTYLLLGDGFLGAFTTFSTFMYEGFNLIGENEKHNAFFYILGSLLIGVAGFVAGFALGNTLL